MRKNIKALAVLLVLAAIGPVAFSQESRKGAKAQEISVGVGGPSLWPLLANIGYDSCGPQGMLESLYGTKYGDEHYTPSVTVTYHYNSKKTFSFATTLSYCGSYSYVYTGINSSRDHLDTSTYLTILESVRLHYLNKEAVRLYSATGVGITLNKGEVLPSLQVTVLGVSFGKRIFGFAEYGLGMGYDLLHGGIGYRF